MPGFYELKTPHWFTWSRPGHDRQRDGSGGFFTTGPTALGSYQASLSHLMTVNEDIRDEAKPGTETLLWRWINFQNDAGQAPAIKPNDLLTQIDTGDVWTVTSIRIFPRTLQCMAFTTAAPA